MKKLSFKQSIFSVLALGLSLAQIAPVAASAASNGLLFQDEGIQPLAVTVSYYSDIRSRGVAWTTMQATNGVLEVVASDSETNIDWSKAQVINAERKVEDGTYYTYQAYVEDLTEDTYYYRVGSQNGNAYSAVGSFQIDHSESEVNFIYATDSQDYNETGFAEWEKLVGAAYETMPNAQFFAMGGDIVNDSHTWGDRDLDQWIYALDMPKEYFMNSVFMPVAGNHDDWAESFTNRFAIDYQGPTQSGGYYSFDYANMHFVALNTNENAWSDTFKAQLDWLKDDLAQTDQQWKVVMLHKGPISTGDHSNDGDVQQVRELLLPIMAEYEVDMVLQGHDHVYARSKPYHYGKNANGEFYNGKTPNLDETLITETVDGESVTYSVEPNGTFYMTANYAGRKSYPPVNYDASTIFPAVNPYNGLYMSQQIKQQMFTTVRISGGTLRFDAYTFDGTKSTLYDSYYVIKDTHKNVEADILDLPNADEADILDYENIKNAQTAYNALVPNAVKKMDGSLTAKLQTLMQKFPQTLCEDAYALAKDICDVGAVAPTQEFLNTVKSLKRRYADLSEEQKAFIVNYGEIAEKETVYKDMLYAKAVTDMAKLCAETESVSAMEVYLAYDSLTETQKAYVNLNGVERPSENSEEKGCSGSISASGVGIMALGIALCWIIKNLKWREENA